MSGLRKVAMTALLVAGAWPAVSASAQNYGPQGYGPIIVQMPGQAQPQPMYFNRVIVQHDPYLGRAYPYMTATQPVIVPAPPRPPRAAHRKAKPAKVMTSRAGKETGKNIEKNTGKTRSAIKSGTKAARTHAPADLIEELKKRPRIKTVSIEETTASIPPARAPEAAPSRGKRSRAGGDKDVRVIRAEAEVRIIGDDQMSIRLFRKRAPAQASAE